MLAGVSSWGAPCEAAPPPISLDWDAPTGCPNSGDVIAAVGKLVGESARTAGPLHAHAVVRAAGDSRFRVALDIDRSGTLGTRALDAESCDAAGDAVALMIAIALDPMLSSAPPAAAPAEVPAETPSTVPAPAQPLVQSQADPAAMPLEHASTSTPAQTDAAAPPLELALVAVGDVGTLPAPSAGVGGLAGWRRGRLRLEGGALYVPSQRATLAASARGGTFSLTAGQLRACASVLDRGRLSLAPCVGMELDVMHGEGFGVDVPLTADGTWFAGTAGGIARLALGGGGLRIGVDGVMPTSRPQFELAGIAAVHRPAAMSARLALGLDVRF
jgi:hypothetical protein